MKKEAEDEDAYGTAGKDFFFNALPGSATDPTGLAPSRNVIPRNFDKRDY